MTDDTSLLAKIREAVSAQANDETLWNVNVSGKIPTVSIGEAYLQQSLRWLHKVIEDNDEDAFDSIVNQANGDI